MRNSLSVVILTIFVFWISLGLMVGKVESFVHSNYLSQQLDLMRSRASILAVVDDKDFALSSMMSKLSNSEYNAHWIIEVNTGSDSEKAVSFVTELRPSNSDVDSLVKFFMKQNAKSGSKMLDSEVAQMVGYSSTPDGFVVLGKKESQSEKSFVLLKEVLFVSSMAALIALLLSFLVLKFYFFRKNDEVKD